MQLSRHCASTFPFLADRPPVAFQRSPNRLPILRRGFHHYFLDLLLDQPLGKSLQLLGVATKPSPLEFVFAGTLNVGHHYSQHLLMHVNSRYPISHCFLLGGKRRACRELHIQAHVAIAAPASRRQQRPFIRSITHAPGQTGSQPQLLHCVFRPRRSRAFPIVLGLSNDFHEVSRAVGPKWQGRVTERRRGGGVLTEKSLRITIALLDPTR